MPYYSINREHSNYGIVWHSVSDSRDVFSPVTDYFIYFYTASMFAFLLRKD